MIASRPPFGSTSRHRQRVRRNGADAKQLGDGAMDESQDPQQPPVTPHNGRPQITGCAGDAVRPGPRLDPTQPKAVRGPERNDLRSQSSRKHVAQMRLSSNHAELSCTTASDRRLSDVPCERRDADMAQLVDSRP